MTTTHNDDDLVEIFPALRVERSLLEAIKETRAELEELRAKVELVMDRAAQILIQADAVVRAHPKFSDPDDFPLDIPGLAELCGWVHEIGGMAEAAELAPTLAATGEDYWLPACPA